MIYYAHKGHAVGYECQREPERDVGPCPLDFEFIAQYGNLVFFFIQKNMYLLFKNTVDYSVYCGKKETKQMYTK